MKETIWIYENIIDRKDNEIFRKFDELSKFENQYPVVSIRDSFSYEELIR